MKFLEYKNMFEHNIYYLVWKLCLLYVYFHVIILQIL
jgi:hypothetical protein